MARRAMVACCVCLACVSPGGCLGGASGEAFRPAMVEAGRGVIYLYRASEGAFGGSGRVSITLDDVPMGELGDGRYLALEAEPGDHFVRVEREGEAVARCDVAAGDSVYLRIRVGSFGRLVIEPVDTPTGQREISRTMLARDAAGR